MRTIALLSLILLPSPTSASAQDYVELIVAAIEHEMRSAEGIAEMVTDRPVRIDTVSVTTFLAAHGASPMQDFSRLASAYGTATVEAVAEANPGLIQSLGLHVSVSTWAATEPHRTLMGILPLPPDSENVRLELAHRLTSPGSFSGGTTVVLEATWDGEKWQLVELFRNII